MPQPPPLLYSVEVLAVGFLISMAGSILPQLSRLRKNPIRMLEESFFRSFSALAVQTSYWAFHSQNEFIVATIGLVMSVLNVKLSTVLEVAGKGPTDFLVKLVRDTIEKASEKDTPK